MGLTQSQRNTKFKKLKKEAGNCGNEIVSTFREEYSEEAFALAIATLYNLIPREFEGVKSIALTAIRAQDKENSPGKGRIILPNGKTN